MDEGSNQPSGDQFDRVSALAMPRLPIVRVSREPLLRARDKGLAAKGMLLRWKSPRLATEGEHTDPRRPVTQAESARCAGSALSHRIFTSAGEFPRRPGPSHRETTVNRPCWRSSPAWAVAQRESALFRRVAA